MANDKSSMMANLGNLLREAFVLRNDGARVERLARVYGYADGYMRAMIEAGIASKAELLDVVAESRRGVDGPATAEVVRIDAA